MSIFHQGAELKAFRTSRATKGHKLGSHTLSDAAESATVITALITSEVPIPGWKPYWLEASQSVSMKTANRRWKISRSRSFLAKSNMHKERKLDAKITGLSVPLWRRTKRAIFYTSKNVPAARHP